MVLHVRHRLMSFLVLDLSFSSSFSWKMSSWNALYSRQDVKPTNYLTGGSVRVQIFYKWLKSSAPFLYWQEDKINMITNFDFWENSSYSGSAFVVTRKIIWNYLGKLQDISINWSLSKGKLHFLCMLGFFQSLCKVQKIQQWNRKLWWLSSALSLFFTHSLNKKL